jgi:hypothetical protein
MAGLVMAPEVAAALGDHGRARLRELIARGAARCLACRGFLDVATEDVTVRCREGAAAELRVAFAHAACASSGFDEPYVRQASDTAWPQMTSIAVLAHLRDHPVVAVDGSISVNRIDGPDWTDVVVTELLGCGFELVTEPLEELEPMSVPVLRGWSMRLTDSGLEISGGDPVRMLYEGVRTPEAVPWSAEAAPGPVLVLTGSGLSPASSAGVWMASLEAARRAGRLVAARMPLR